jgi:hypothetical protein
MTSRRARWYADELITRAGRTLRPDSSENTEPTRTTSARSQAIIRGVLAIVPQLREQWVRLGIQGQPLFALLSQVFAQAFFNRLPVPVLAAAVTEGFESRDLRDANALLDELSRGRSEEADFMVDERLRNRSRKAAATSIFPQPKQPPLVNAQPEGEGEINVAGALAGIRVDDKRLDERQARAAHVQHARTMRDKTAAGRGSRRSHREPLTQPCLGGIGAARLLLRGLQLQAILGLKLAGSGALFIRPGSWRAGSSPHCTESAFALPNCLAASSVLPSRRRTAPRALSTAELGFCASERL